ncbi:MAG: tail fiber domain-containing protein [Acetobacter sp.]|nr:tail fiber domain-containing protein [Acetobacter sp.]
MGVTIETKNGKRLVPSAPDVEKKIQSELTAYVPKTGGEFTGVIQIPAHTTDFALNDLRDKIPATEALVGKAVTYLIKDAESKYSKKDHGHTAATSAAAGFMSSADKSKLDGIQAGAQVNPGIVTESSNGLMLGSDKAKLNNIDIPTGQEVPIGEGRISLNDDLSGKTIYFNTSYRYGGETNALKFNAMVTVLESSGGYRIYCGGPPDIYLYKNSDSTQTTIAKFYTYVGGGDMDKWEMSSYTLPSDFGTVTTLGSWVNDGANNYVGIHPVISVQGGTVLSGPYVLPAEKDSVIITEQSLYEVGKLKFYSKENKPTYYDIGAAPSSHTSSGATTSSLGHVYLSCASGIGSSSSTNSYVAERFVYSSTSSVNLDSYKAEGRFCFYSASTLTNAPVNSVTTGNKGIYLEVRTWSSYNYVHQTLYYRDTNRRFTRYYSYGEGKWTRWLSNPRELTEYVVDLSSTTYNRSYWYPVTIAGATTHCRDRIEVWGVLGETGVPTWATHSEGFACSFVVEFNGNGWGAISEGRKILLSEYSFCDQNPIGGVDQMTNSSTEVIWVRGGGKYRFRVSSNLAIPTPRSSTYTINSGSDSNGNPYTQSVSYKTAPDTLNLSLTNLNTTESISGQKQFTAPLTFFSTSTRRGSESSGAGIARGVLPIGWPTTVSTSSAMYSDINGKLTNGGFSLSQGINESSGIFFSGDHIAMWSPCDTDPIKYYDEDNGNLVFSINNSATLSTTSDKRLKEDIEDLVISDDKFLQIRPKSFRFKKYREKQEKLLNTLSTLDEQGYDAALKHKYAEAVDDSTEEGKAKALSAIKAGISQKVEELKTSSIRKDVGVIAQELEDLLPDLVRTDGTEESYRTVDYVQLHMFTLAKLQDILRRVKKLEERSK